MKVTFLMSTLFFLLFITSFCSVKPSEERNVTPVDSTKYLKIGRYNVLPKASFALNSVVKSSEDTLYLVTCSEFVYFPFGTIKTKNDLKLSLLKNFSRTTKTINNKEEFEVLKLNGNELMLFFDNDPSATIESYIIKGKINTPEVNFVNGMKIGIEKKQFFDYFFESFPKELEGEYKTIVFESCVNGIKHIYNFNNNSLYSLKFECVDCTWKIDY